MIGDNFFEYFSTDGKQRYWSIVFISCLSPFLKMGVTLASLHMSGYIEVASMFLKIILMVI